MNTDAHRSWLERLSHALLREPQDRSQLITLLHDAKERHLLDQDALAMIEGVLKISEMRIRDVMIARAQMVVVTYDAMPNAVLSTVIDSAHSRFPVISESRDTVVGILLAKDLLQYIAPTQNQIKKTSILIKDIARPALFVPEGKRLDILLKEFRLNRNHMAIVVDEYDTVSGLITIEDVLEQIVGNIEDETDINNLPEPHIKKLSEGKYCVNALTSIEECNHYFTFKLNDEDFDTIGGYAMQQFGHLPRVGEAIELNEFILTVISASNRRLKTLELDLKR